MSMHLDTKTLVPQLKSLSKDIVNIEVHGPGGDFDSATMIVFLSNKEYLHLTFWRDYIDNLRLTPQVEDNVDIKFVQMSDGLNGSGGLFSKSRITSQVFYDFRQYFLDNGVEEVIDHYDEIY